MRAFISNHRKNVDVLLLYSPEAMNYTKHA